MAKVLNPLNSMAARGKVGALVYNQTGGINYVKAKTSPSQPRTARQMKVRAILQKFTRGWSALDAGERAAWAVWAGNHPVTDPFGTVIVLSGYNWYCGLNARIEDLAKTPIDEPPTEYPPDYPASVVLTPGAGQISCAFTPYAGTDVSVDVWLLGPHSAGRDAKIEHAVHKAYGPGETTPLVITSLSAGLHTVWIRAVSETDGQVSPFVKATATVT